MAENRSVKRYARSAGICLSEGGRSR